MDQAINGKVRKIQHLEQQIAALIAKIMNQDIETFHACNRIFNQDAPTNDN